MRKEILIFIAALTIFISCGIEPPRQDLEKAKSTFAKAEQVEAQTYAPDEYKSADKMLIQGQQVMVTNEKSSKNKDALKYFQDAQKKAEAAYKKAAPKYTDKNINEGQKALDSAKEIKADVAVKDEFAKADNLLKEANAAKAKKDYETAWKKAKEAKTVAEKAREIAEQKRSKAKSSIDEAKNKLDSVKK